MNILEIVHRWADVQSSQGYNYIFPIPVSPHMKKEYCRPAVYRWMVWTPGSRIHAYYVGETENLARRIQDNPTDKDLYVDSGDLKWKQDDHLLRGLSTWVLFKIEKYSKRNDFPTRSWYQNWAKLLDDTMTGSVAADAFKSRYQQAITLLQNDPDFTSGDKRRYVTSFTTVRDLIVTELNKPSPDYKKIKDAITASQEPVQQAQRVVAGKRVTAVNTDSPIWTLDFTQGVARMAIVPDKLAYELRILNP